MIHALQFIRGNFANGSAGHLVFVPNIHGPHIFVYNRIIGDMGYFSLN